MSTLNAILAKANLDPLSYDTKEAFLSGETGGASSTGGPFRMPEVRNRFILW